MIPVSAEQLQMSRYKMLEYISNEAFEHIKNPHANLNVSEILMNLKAYLHCRSVYFTYTISGNQEQQYIFFNLETEEFLRGFTSDLLDDLPRPLMNMSTKADIHRDVNVHWMGEYYSYASTFILHAGGEKFGVAYFLDSWLDANQQFLMYNTIQHGISSLLSSSKERLRSIRIEDENRKLKEQTERQVEKMTTILSSSPDQFYLFSQKGECYFASPVSLEFLDMELMDIVGMSISQISLFKQMGSQIIDDFQFVIREHAAIRNDFFHGDDLYHRRYFQYVLTPVFDTSGDNVEEVVISIRETTNFKRVEMDLIEAREKAVKANQSKSDFLANMSHEIRTPLNAILGMSDLLAETNLNAEQKRYVDIFRRAGDNLLTVINDVLDLSKVEAGQMSVESIDLSIRDIIDDVVEILYPRAIEKGIQLEASVSQEVPKWILGDPVRLRQILINLIGNAIKFTSKGKVQVNVQKNINPEHPGDYQFSIQDEGIGIPADKLPLLFQAFSQADTSVTRKFGGTGLGLAICKQLSHLMGGSIWVQSEVNRGSIFSFTIQGPNSSTTKNKLHVSDTFSGKIRYFITENRLRDFVESFLKSESLFLFAESFSNLQDLHSVLGQEDIIVLNCHHEFATKENFEFIKQLTLKYPKVQILFIPQDIGSIKSLELQAFDSQVHWMRLPLKFREASEYLTKWMTSKSQKTMQKNSNSSDQGISKYRLLLVDDSEENRMLVQAYLKSEPYHVQTASNGRDAVDLIHKNQFDLVLMDVQMPVMDGLTATRIVRKWEQDMQLPQLPIIALTAHALREEEEKSFQAGCQGHLTKPIKKAFLIQYLKQFLTSEGNKKESAA